jgi:SHS family lactate transporter-like MFS transporter
LPTSPSDRRHAVAAGFLGWTLDAFDFFVVVFLVDTLALHFHVAKTAIVWTMTATLAMRPVGAIVFGLLADRYGRRRPLMANVIFFSVVELLCGFAPSYTVFLILRTIYGIGMGGEWGVGASLAMESAPPKWRGILSGIVQSGYSIGYLLAAVAARFVLPAWGWRAMFWVGGAPALLALYIRFRVRESEAWQQRRAPTVGAILRTATDHWRIFLYLVLMMTLMMFLSHGTQDLYPDFLKTGRGFDPKIVAFMMQAGVQGAWGIIPAHLNELSPDAVRGLMPGFAYQMGILIAAPVNNVVYALRKPLGYPWALATFEIANIAVLMTVIALGSERKGKSFGGPDQLSS